MRTRIQRIGPPAAVMTGVLTLVVLLLAGAPASEAAEIRGTKVGSDNHFDYYYESREPDGRYGNVKWSLVNRTDAPIYVSSMLVSYGCADKPREHYFSRTVEPGAPISVSGWDDVCGGDSRVSRGDVLHVSMKRKGDPYNRVVCEDESRHYFLVDHPKPNLLRIVTTTATHSFNAREFNAKKLIESVCEAEPTESLIKDLNGWFRTYSKSRLKAYEKECAAEPQSPSCEEVKRWTAIAGVRG